MMIAGMVHLIMSKFCHMRWMG